MIFEAIPAVGVLPVSTVAHPQPASIPIDSDGGNWSSFYYDDSPTYGAYDPTGGADGTGSNQDSDNPTYATLSAKADTYLTSVQLTYNGTTVSDGLSGNQPVTALMNSTLNTILENDPTVVYANVYATTNGHKDTPNSDHVSGNAVDINFINGVHVGTSGEGFALATSLETAAKENPNVRYVEGPMGNYKRGEDGTWLWSKHLPGDTTHVHISVWKFN